MELPKDQLLNITIETFVEVLLGARSVSEIEDQIPNDFIGYGAANDEETQGKNGFIKMVERQKRD
jgi:hypothetical protein